MSLPAHAHPAQAPGSISTVPGPQPSPSKSPPAGNAELAALALLAAVRLWIASWAPMVIPTDALDYINAGRWLGAHASLALVPGYKSPLLALILGALYAISDHAPTLLGVLQAILGILSAAFAWDLLRTRFGRAWGVAGALLVGLHPVLLGYERVLLRESLAAFLIMATAWTLTRATRERPTHTLAWAGSLGVLLGLGALLRENFQAVAAIGLLTLALAPGSLRRRFARTACAVGVCLLVCTPWAVHLHARNRIFGVCLPKTQFNRVINAYNAGLLPAALPPGVNPARWDPLRARAGLPPSDYEYVAELIVNSSLLGGRPAPDTPVARVELVIETMESDAPALERLCASAFDEAARDNPGGFFRHRFQAMINQIGLYRFPRLAASRANDWMLLEMQALWTPTGTNFLFNDQEAIAQGRFLHEPESLRRVLDAARVSTKDLLTSPGARAFAQWYHAWEFLRPALAILFLIGAAAGAWTRWQAGVFLGVVALVNMIGAAWLTLTPWDRASTPFLTCVCVLAIGAIAASWQKLTSPRAKAS